MTSTEKSCSKQRRKLYFVKAFSLTQLINEPTRVTEKSQTLLHHMSVTATDNIRKHHVPNQALLAQSGEHLLQS